MISINRHTILNRYCSRVQHHSWCTTAALALVLFNSCSDRRWEVPESALESYSDSQTLDIRNVILNLPENRQEAFATWNQATGAFGSIYTEDVLRIGAANNPETVEKLKAFATHPDVKPIESAITQHAEQRRNSPCTENVSPKASTASIFSSPMRPRQESHG